MPRHGVVSSPNTAGLVQAVFNQQGIPAPGATSAPVAGAPVGDLGVLLQTLFSGQASAEQLIQLIASLAGGGQQPALSLPQGPPAAQSEVEAAFLGA